MDALSFYEKEERPWGNFERFTLNEKSTVKIITVLPHEELSLQKHSHRSEFWKVISGNGSVTLHEGKKDIVPGDMISVPQGIEHRITGGDTELVILEIAFGNFDENDITRLEDKYGRA